MLKSFDEHLYDRVGNKLHGSCTGLYLTVQGGPHKTHFFFSLYKRVGLGAGCQQVEVTEHLQARSCCEQAALHSRIKINVIPDDAELSAFLL